MHAVEAKDDDLKMKIAMGIKMKMILCTLLKQKMMI